MRREELGIKKISWPRYILALNDSIGIGYSGKMCESHTKFRGIWYDFNTFFLTKEEKFSSY
jgi:hypothetical protein